MEGKEPQLRAFALIVSQEIKSHWPQVAAGLILQGVVDKWPWTFGRVPEWEIEDNTPTQGLKFTYIGGTLFSGSLFKVIDPANLPEKLVCVVQNIYSRCVKKFATYSHARCVLVLDPYADLRYQDVGWWQGVFSVVPPPAEIHEIWLGVFDWVEDDSEGWIFERLTGKR